MKVLLVAINAKYIHSNLAVYSLKAYAEHNMNSDCEIEIAEYTINQYTDKILQDIYMKKPDVIGFSCYIWNISMVEDILADISKVLPNVKIWLGGPEVSYIAPQVLEKHHNVTGVMRGEGEVIFSNICNGMELSQIKGITYRDGEMIVDNDNQPLLDMSDIPFPYDNIEDFENRIIYYESSRGCPFSCSYCLSSIDKQLRFRNIDLVKRELKFFVEQNVAQVKFVDRTFNCKHEHAMEIWKYISQIDNGRTNFHFEIAADLLNDEELEVIAKLRPGLVQLEIGVQTTNVETISAINRKMDFDKLSGIVSKLKENNNVHLHLDLIAGLPKENLESFANSFNQVYWLKPEQLQLGFLKVLHGSNMKKQAEEYGIEYQTKPPYEVYSTKWITYEEVLQLKKVEEVLEIYYNSGQFANSIKELEKYYNTPFEMYSNLGDFYHSASINGEKHSRIRRYELLLDFFKKKVVHNEIQDRVFVQLLVLDVYLRDNIKSRPSFALSNEEFRKNITSIYIQEAECRSLLPDYKEYDSKQLAKMTHIEHFDFDIDKYVKFGQHEKTDYYLLFDYKNRDALIYDAGIVVVPNDFVDRK